MEEVTVSACERLLGFHLQPGEFGLGAVVLELSSRHALEAVRVGMRLLSVENVPVALLPFEEVQSLLSVERRPLQLTFCGPRRRLQARSLAPLSGYGASVVEQLKQGRALEAEKQLEASREVQELSKSQGIAYKPQAAGSATPPPRSFGIQGMSSSGDPTLSTLSSLLSGASDSSALRGGGSGMQGGTPRGGKKQQGGPGGGAATPKPTGSAPLATPYSVRSKARMERPLPLESLILAPHASEGEAKVEEDRMQALAVERIKKFSQQEECLWRAVCLFLGGGSSAPESAAHREPVGPGGAAVTPRPPTGKAIPCRGCGKTFLFSLRQQERYAESGWGYPGQCFPCLRQAWQASLEAKWRRASGWRKNEEYLARGPAPGGGPWREVIGSREEDLPSYFHSLRRCLEPKVLRLLEVRTERERHLAELREQRRSEEGRKDPAQTPGLVRKALGIPEGKEGFVAYLLSWATSPASSGSHPSVPPAALCPGCGKEGGREQCLLCKTRGYCTAQCRSDHFAHHARVCRELGLLGKAATFLSRAWRKAREVRTGLEDGY
jgi:hypothetical protein